MTRHEIASASFAHTCYLCLFLPNFAKLRDIELMIQDRIALIENPMEGDEKIPEGGPEEVLLKQIQAVLYSTEDGFEVPEGQEVSVPH
jgi:RP/EB family microtubule-associated protein